ncbi:MAG: cobalamin biosynthesis protein CobW [Rhodospirillales bacterium]|nr:cobalamin biosynthesis protein CobW [Rhodospirillales bacterium]
MKIPATIVTGFLGAGKTSLIRHLLTHARGRRIAVVINEFGDLGVDRELLVGCGVTGCADEDLIELPNGCICCTVADAFLPTLQRLLDRPEPPEHIVIETSGLALPKPLVKAFQWPEVKAHVTVDGVIAVIDAPAVAAGRFASDEAAIAAERAADPALDHDEPLRELFEDQLTCADMVVLNKIDSLDENKLGKVSAEVADLIRPETKVVLAVRGGLDPLVVLGIDAAAELSIDALHSHHDNEEDHDHDEFVSFVAELGPIEDPIAFERRVRAVAAEHDVLRLKGFLDVPGKPMRHVVQSVGTRVERYFDRPWQSGEARRSHVVVIAQKGIDEAAVRTALQG